ncbi:MAG: 5-(carboxyamino)imidazole ribonucleotide mutase [Acidobacteriota bacterium]
MSHTNPIVGILMGSDSDWPVMEDAAKTLDRFGVACEVRVISAHRRPDDCAEYARTAAARGVKVLIAGAGGAAHLAGVLAAHTSLPVIAVPVPTPLAGGLDSLLSMVQMPPGVPVATVGVGRSGNAALLAVQMLALADSPLAERLHAYKRELAEKGAAADHKLQEARRGLAAQG